MPNIIIEPKRLVRHKKTRSGLIACVPSGACPTHLIGFPGKLLTSIYARQCLTSEGFLWCGSKLAVVPEEITDLAY